MKRILFAIMILAATMIACDESEINATGPCAGFHKDDYRCYETWPEGWQP